MDKKKHKCVFDMRAGSKGCHALNEKICLDRECRFYKSEKEYRLVEGGHVEKRRNDLSLSQY